MKPLILSAPVLFVLALSGCARHTEPIVDLTPTTPSARSFQANWQAGLDVLRDYGFTIQRKDRRAGLILTEPMVSQYPTEIWRKDVSNPVQAAESAIHKIYRAAIVEIRPGGGSGEFQARTRVLAGRSEGPQPQVTHASQIARVYAGSAGGRDYQAVHIDPHASPGLVEGPGQQGQVTWVPLSRTKLRMSNVTELGRDVELEARINADIRRQGAHLLSKMQARADADPAPEPEKTPPAEPTEATEGESDKQEQSSS
jgi:hypothetical protein